MRILWLCNIVAPQFRKKLNLSGGYGGGWIEQTLELLAEEKNCELGYCAPMKGKLEITKTQYRGVKFYGFSKKIWYPEKYDESVENIFHIILTEFKPDIVHIFGTEFPHTLAMVKAFGKPEKTVIHLQGIMTFCAQNYDEGIPYKILHQYTFRDFIRHDNIYQKKLKFEKRAEYEKKALQGTAHVMGRTEWDRACVKILNPNISYHYCGEILREEFYKTPNWNIVGCEKHTLFMAQGDYPIKGLHFALEAIKILKKDIPDVKLYIAGENIIDIKTMKQQIRQSMYPKYIRKLVNEWNLNENIEFVGSLNANQMCTMYQRCHVYIMPSLIENSPNSLCEALGVGTPVVASYVGGIPEFIAHGENGYLYQHNAPYMLAHYVKKIFMDDELAQKISNNGKKSIKNNVNPTENMKILMNIYKNMLMENPK